MSWISDGDVLGGGASAVPSSVPPEHTAGVSTRSKLRRRKREASSGGTPPRQRVSVDAYQPREGCSLDDRACPLRLPGRVLWLSVDEYGGFKSLRSREGAGGEVSACRPGGSWAIIPCRR